MGMSLSWIAVKGVDKPALLEALGLEEVDRQWDLYSPTPPQALATLDDWLIVLAKNFDYPSAERMTKISVGGTALSCSIEEHVMYSVARCYQDGQRVWSVDHDGGKGVHHLDIVGAPPAELAAVSEHLAAQQAAEDVEGAEVDHIFDVPADTIKALCGFKIDDEEADSVVFKLLEPVGGKGGGFLTKLFGRK